MFSIDGKPNCAMRLEKDDDFGTRKPRWRYYRDAGNWSIRFKKEDGKYYENKLSLETRRCFFSCNLMIPNLLSIE